MYSDQITIPSTILHGNQAENDISILIGENGSGKSTMLNAIAKHYIYNTNSKVIAIANSIYDKFNFKHPRLETLKASSGKTIAKRTLKEALKILAKDDNKRQSSIAEALRYVNFDPVVGIRVRGINRDYETLLEEDGILSREDKRNIAYCLESFIRETPYSNDIHRINLHHGNLYDLRDSFLISILIHERAIKALKLISSIDIFLYRDREILPVNSASSGELSLVTSLLYLVASIGSRSVILVDEPENSLHPKWQTEYVKLLVDHFYRYEPKIIIATHSPLIINAAELTSSGIKVFKGENRNFEYMNNDTQNVEEIFQDFFGVTTPENRFLSQTIVNRMNQLAAGELDINLFRREINDFKYSSYSDEQKEVLDGILEMGQKIIDNR